MLFEAAAFADSMIHLGTLFSLATFVEQAKFPNYINDWAPIIETTSGLNYINTGFTSGYTSFKPASYPSVLPLTFFHSSYGAAGVLPCIGFNAGMHNP
eukprot:1159558-Pelagomonas_calceolata.AAC.2